MNIDFGRPFQFAFEDKDWVMKIVIGALVVLGSALLSMVLVGIAGFFILMGYQRRLILNVAEGADTPLPVWDRWGEDLSEGFKLFVVVAGYILPGFILYIGGAIAGALGQEMLGEAGGFLGLISCIGFPLMMVGSLLSPVGILRSIDKGSIGAAFAFGEVFGFIKDNLVNILLAIVIGFIAQFLAQFGIILCLVGVLATGFWAMLIQGHAWGQVLRLSREKQGVPGGAPAPSY